MNRLRSFRVFLIAALVGVLLPLPGCGFILLHGARLALDSNASDERAVDAQLDRYRRFVIHGDGEALAAMFDNAAQISHSTQPPVIGEESIRAHFRAFSRYRVLDYRIRAESTAVHGDTAEQRGTYHQEIVSPDGDRASAEGVFDARWKRKANGDWLLSRMHTEPSPGAVQ